MGEFDLIARHFQRPAGRAASGRAASGRAASGRAAPGRAPLGIGDDCALLAPSPGLQLAVSSDMLVEGQHFIAGTDPEGLGHKALAVNLSDLAACGASPLAFTLALALPRADDAWLSAFARGMFALADAHGCELVGGDTTRGPLTICITVMGEVPPGQALLRSGAQVGDDLYVSGTLGDARLALEALQGRIRLPAEVLEPARQRLERPTPRNALGLALRGLATSAIDVSDGLLGDLGHVLKASGTGATVLAQDAIKLIAASACLVSAGGQFDSDFLLERVLAGGDDYELAFTAAPAARARIAAAAHAANTPVSRIGHIDAEPGLRVVDGGGKPLALSFASFDHFLHSD